MAKTNWTPLLIGIIVLMVAVFAISQLGGDEETYTPPPPPPPAQTPLPVGVVPTVAPANIVSAKPLNSGAFDLYLKAMNGGTGTTSNVILLDPKKHAYDVDGVLSVVSLKPFNEARTKYEIMKVHYNLGLDGLTSINGGTPKALTPTSGLWEEAQLSARVGDQLIVFTYLDTTPARNENISTVKLMTLTDFYRETGKWVAQTSQGETAWNLFQYADYQWVDGSDSNATAYTYGDSGTAASNAVMTWYTRAWAIGEKCNDCGIFVNATTNFTSKFKSLVINDKFGHSAKFTTLTKAGNFGGDDPRGIAANILNTASDPRAWYWVGYIPDDFMTTYTTGDKNRVSWELTSDTYGSNVTMQFAIVQNAKALISNNGPFVIRNYFALKFANTATSAWNEVT